MTIHPKRSQSWSYTPTGERRGYIDPHALSELWFHTGTVCNLACPFCLEGSKPGDDRLGRMTLAEVRPLIDEAVALGVEQLSFTGGEPFVIRDMIAILAYAAERRPCLVLTNGTLPLHRRMDQLRALADAANPIRFRVSLDYPDRALHDAGRGEGSFDQALEGLAMLHGAGFGVSVARQMKAGEDEPAIRAGYAALFRARGLPEDLTLVPFPDFLTPDALPQVPQVTTACMTTYQDDESRRDFMCAFSKMVIKKGGRMRVYACTLVDDDEEYDLGGTLAESMDKRVSMKHHRCYSCFAFGSSCSEL